MRRGLKSRNGKSKGLVLVLVALIFLVLVAFIGLAIDVGMVFVNYATLRRAVDSAALAAATKYRLNVPEADMEKIALEYLRLNGVDDPAAVVTTCDSEPGLCPSGEERKLVHVVASTSVATTFISVLGFSTIDVTAEAVSEAASLDVILVLDTSESMTFDEPKANAAAHGGLDFRDPQICNADDPSGSDGFPGECHPFEEVKAAAVEFVNQLYFPYDRVGVVTFDHQDHGREGLRHRLFPGSRGSPAEIHSYGPTGHDDLHADGDRRVSVAGNADQRTGQQGDAGGQGPLVAGRPRCRRPLPQRGPCRRTVSVLRSHGLPRTNRVGRPVGRHAHDPQPGRSTQRSSAVLLNTGGKHYVRVVESIGTNAAVEVSRSALLKEAVSADAVHAAAAAQWHGCGLTAGL